MYSGHSYIRYKNILLLLHTTALEHLEEKKKWEDSMKKKEEERNKMTEQIEKDKVRVQELDVS